VFFESIHNKYKKYLISTGVVGLVTVGMAVPAHAQQTDEMVEFNIPAQKLSNALKSYGVTADRQVLFAVNLVRGKQANAVSGELQPDMALDKLLMGSGLAYETTASDVVVIKTVQRDTADGQMLRVASIGEDDVGDTTISDTERSEPQQLEDQQLEEIIVTGTNIRGVQNPTTPVLQFDRRDIELSGVATVEDFLRTMPQNFNASTPIAFDSANDSGKSNTLSGTSIDLRGLGAGATLTLLNGRRMTASGNGSFVDVSVLPLGAIERVEVLTDGASAVYGSDAVGGVVNFITRKDFEGLEVSGRYGTVTDGSQEDYKLGAAGGRSWDGGGAMFGVDYFDQQPLMTRERDFIDLTIADNPVGSIGAESQMLSAFASINQNLANRVSFATDALYSNRESGSFQNLANQLEFRNEQDSYYINSRLDHELTDEITVSLFYDYSREDATSTNSRDFSDVSNTRNRLYVVEGAVSGQSLTLPSGDKISFAIGGLYRNEKLEADYLIGLSSVERDVNSAYGELLIPLIADGNAGPFAKAFDISLAGRYEDYSDFGNTFNPKIGLHWAPSEDLSLRASLSESFRAPTLQEVFGGTLAQIQPVPNFFFTAFPSIAQDPTGQTITLFTSGANPNLTEETADVWSAGLDYAPSHVSGLKLSATYFNVDYNDRVENIIFIDALQISEFSILATPDPDAAFVTEFFERAEAPNFILFNGVNATPDDVEFVAEGGQQNIASRKVEGFDVLVDYQVETSYGDFSTSLNATYLLEYQIQLTELSSTIDQVSILYRPIDLKLRGDVSWSRDGLTAVLAVNHTSGYRDNIDRSIANDIDAWTTVDLTLSYDTRDTDGQFLLDETRLSVNVRNLLDEDPPFVTTIDGFNFDTANANPFGRQIAVSLTKSF